MGERETLFADAAVRFPGQSSPDRSRRYIDDLAKLGFLHEDWVEGWQRVYHTREQATFPPYAVVYRSFNEARALRLKGSRNQYTEPDFVKPPVVYGGVPVRGVRDTSPAYRDPAWWDAHPDKSAGKTMKVGFRKWLLWHKDTRPWAVAEAEHRKFSTGKPRKSERGLMRLDGVLEAAQQEEVPF